MTSPRRSLSSSRRSLMRRLSDAFSSYIAPGPVITPTPRETLRAAAAASMFEGNLDVEASSVITSWKGVEGDLYLMEAGPDARRYFVKHTRITSYEDKDNEGDYPNEAKMLFGKIGPHPRIVRLFRCSPDPDDRTRWFLKMEFCAGGDLGSQYEHWLYRLRSGMPEVFLLHFIVSAVEALAFLHHGLRYAGNGRWTQDAAYESIIHGDLKEGNFFLRWTPIPIGGLPEVVLGDFGTAKIAGRRNAKTNIGTLCFGSPEDVAIYGTAIPSPATRQIFQTAVNARTVAHDMYSLGLMVYMFATRSRDPTAIGTDPATLRISREYETPGIVTLLQKMLVVDPATRARASFHAVHGVLPAVDALRDARDRIIADRRVLDRMEFSSPPAMPTRYTERITCIFTYGTRSGDQSIDGIFYIQLSPSLLWKVRKDNAILSIAINSMERDVLYEQLTQVSEGELFGDLKRFWT